MIFEQFEIKGLAHYSYIVACDHSRRAVVVDPKRDIDTYVEYTRRHELTIAHVLETHIHADFASGAVELARSTGATHWASAYDRGQQFEAAFPHTDLKDGDSVELGSVRLQAIHTPGHTPEHLSFLIFPEGASTPTRLLSGDFLFIGSVGRPDLLGDAATQELAEQMYDSVRTRLDGLPDALEICPGHGAGSMCGAGMASRAASTLGAERMSNPYLDQRLSKAEFVHKLIGSAPPFPPYYRRMKRVNAAGPAILNGLPGSRPIDVPAFASMVDSDHAVIDLRGQLPFGEGHVPGSFGIGLGTNLSTWAAWVVPYDTPLLLVAARPEDVADASRSLVRVGLDDIQGYLAGGFDAWRAAGKPVATTRQIAPPELQQRLDAGRPIRVIDVRSDSEWNSAHIGGAVHIMGGYVADRAAELGRGAGDIAVVCGSGYRSTVIASVLERAGVQNVLNVTGGMQAWQAAGLPVVSG